ncbi:hypothetical protein [Egicoccus sp. AB-alg6-2]|uniref:hypothetical protein n=1 Tax=Egicoccus sp. AB-alg6-2 TaxID=3242692 RepID=UPI00359ED3D6
MSRRRFLPLLLVLLVYGCSGAAVDDVPPTDGVAAPDAPGSPAEEPVPPEDEPGVDAPSGDAPMEPLPRLVADWEQPFDLGLPNGWMVGGCTGDAPLLCFFDGTRQVGFLELGRYPLPEHYDGDAAGYLAHQADDFLVSMREDRAAGCPNLTFDPTPPIDVIVGGQPGVRAGFRLVDADGTEVERHVVYWTVHDGEHVTVTAPAYADRGCIEPMGEFSPADLGLVTLFVDQLVADTPLPPSDSAD